MLRTKDLKLTNTIYQFLKDNFIILNEYNIERYNDKVFSIFKKYNKKTFKLSFIDCSAVVITNYYDLDYVVSFDKEFRLFEEINLFKLKEI